MLEAPGGSRLLNCQEAVAALGSGCGKVFEHCLPILRGVDGLPYLSDPWRAPLALHPVKRYGKCLVDSPTKSLEQRWYKTYHTAPTHH